MLKQPLSNPFPKIKAWITTHPAYETAYEIAQEPELPDSGLLQVVPPPFARDNPRYVELYDGPASLGWKAALDFRRDTGGNYILRFEIRFPTLEVPDEQGDWTVVERYDLHFARPRADGNPAEGVWTYINGTATNPSQILIVEPPRGPWEARLTLAQVSGRMTAIPYLIYR